MAKRAMRVTIGGRQWRIVFGKVKPSLCGECDYDTRTIRISDELEGVERLDTIIHEVAHAAFPIMAEESVLEFGSELAAILDRLGYRC